MKQRKTKDEKPFSVQRHVKNILTLIKRIPMLEARVRYGFYESFFSIFGDIIAMTGLTPEDFPKDPVSRVEYLQHNLGIPDQFFLTLLEIPQKSLEDWKKGINSLSTDNLETLGFLWDVMVDLRGVSGNKNSALKDFFEKVAGQDPALNPNYHKRITPWAGTSIMAFIEAGKIRALEELNIWTHRPKFG